MKIAWSINILIFLLFNCSEKRTYLTDEIKAINPYKPDQMLVFESSMGLTNELRISKIEDGRFPDALGAPTNERMIVLAYRLSQTERHGTTEDILHFAAIDNEHEEEITFKITLRDAGMYPHWLTLSEYQKLKSHNFKTPYYELDDVLVFDLPPKIHRGEQTFKQISWSKSIGYVQMIQNDGTVWNLKEITNR